MTAATLASLLFLLIVAGTVVLVGAAIRQAHHDWQTARSATPNRKDPRP